jgi:hypothetical protein
MKKLYYIFLITIISCSKGDNKNCNQIINVAKLNNDDLYIDEIFESCSFKKLETTEKGLFSIPSKVSLAEDRLFFLLNRPENCILIFNKNGNFIGKINNQGKGPKEYGLLVDIQYDVYTNSLVGFDKHGKLFYYSKDGHLIKTLKCSRSVSSFFPIQDGMLYYHGNAGTTKKKYRLEILKDKKNYYFLPNKDFKPYLNINDIWNFVPYGDTILFSYAFSERVYLIHNKEVIGTYCIDFGNKSLDKSFFSNKYANIREFMKACENSHKPYMVSNFLISNDKDVFFTFLKEGQRNFVFVDAATQNHLISETLIYRFNNENIVFSELPYVFYNGNLVFLIQAYSFVEKINLLKERLSASEWEKFKIVNNEIFSIYSSTSVMDNPILMYCKF